MAVSYSGFAQPTSGTAAAKAQARKARMEPGNRTVRAVYAGAEARSITAVTAPKELTIELNGRHEMVVVGTTLGMLIANVPVVFAGKLAADRIPFKAIRIVAAAIFAAIGAWVLVAGVPG